MRLPDRSVAGVRLADRLVTEDLHEPLVLARHGGGGLVPDDAVGSAVFAHGTSR